MNFDVIICGLGAMGSAAAYHLALAGLRVCVFDKSEPGQEASWAGAGILSPAPENPATNRPPRISPCPSNLR